MITLLIIIFIVFVIYQAIKNPSDKKSKKEEIHDEEEISKLPNINFKGEPLTSWECVANMFPRKNGILDVFMYNSSDRSIYMRMLDGRSISCPLSKLDVSFDKVNPLFRFYVTDGNTKFSFYNFAYVFSEKQYEVIIGVLLLAGTTHNKSIMGSTYKNLSKISTIVKIISKL